MSGIVAVKRVKNIAIIADYRQLLQIIARRKMIPNWVVLLFGVIFLCKYDVCEVFGPEEQLAYPKIRCSSQKLGENFAPSQTSLLL